MTKYSNINAYLKQTDYRKQWDQKLTSGRTPKMDNNDENQAQSDYIQMGIISRYKSGQKVSRGDLYYLQQKNSPLYPQIAAAVKKQEDYEKRLSNCRSRQEARDVYSAALASAVTPISPGSSPSPETAPVEAMVSEGLLHSIQQEWHYYSNSSHFKKMPEKAKRMDRWSK